MAAVFLISQATLWLRTGVMPRWLALPTHGVALVLLFVVSQSTWVVLIFPAWVLLVSVYILIAHFTQSGAAGLGTEYAMAAVSRVETEDVSKDAKEKP